MADAEHPVVELPEPVAEGDVEALQDEGAKRVGAPAVRNPDRGERCAPVLGRSAVEVEPPRLHRPPRRRREPPVAFEDPLHPLLLQHGDGFLEAEEEVRRRGEREVAGRVRILHRPPVPVAPREVRIRARAPRLLAHRVEAEPGRQHEPLLRARDGHVHPPPVVLVGHGGERGDGVHEEERGVAGRIEGPPHGRHVARRPRRGLVVEHRDGPNRTRRAGIDIPREGLFDRLRVDPRAPVPLDRLHLEAEAPGHLRPEAREVAGLVDEHPVPRREGVDEGRLPRPGAGGREDVHPPPRSQHAAHRVEALAPKGRKLRPPVVDGGPADGLQHPPRHVGRPRDLEEVASGPVTHGLSSNSSDMRRA